MKFIQNLFITVAAMKNILFTSNNTAKLSTILLSTVFSVIAATSADASKPKFLDYDHNGFPTTTQYTSKRGVEYNLGKRTMSLRSNPEKKLWNRASNKRKATDVDVIPETPLKRQKTFDNRVDSEVHFDETPTFSPTFMNPTCGISTPTRYVPQVEEALFDETSFETTSFHMQSPIFSWAPQERTPNNHSASHMQVQGNESEQNQYYNYLVNAVETRQGRMAEHFEMVEELKRLDDASDVPHFNSNNFSSEEELSMDEETAEPIYDFGIDSFKRVATKRNLAVAAGVATGAAIAYKLYTDGFGTLATEALNTAPNFINTTMNSTLPSFFNGTVSSTLGFCPVQEVCTAVYPNVTSSFANTTSSMLVPEVPSFVADVCQAIPSNLTNTFGMQTIVPQVVETVTEQGGSYWNFFSNAFINMNKNTHL